MVNMNIMKKELDISYSHYILHYASVRLNENEKRYDQFQNSDIYVQTMYFTMVKVVVDFNSCCTDLNVLASSLFLSRN